MNRVYSYICNMKTEVNIPDHFPPVKEEDLIAAAERREKYSILRDLQAREFNGAIVSRMEKDKEKAETARNEEKKLINCKKCGKEFSVSVSAHDLIYCPECRLADSVGLSHLYLGDLRGRHNRTPGNNDRFFCFTCVKLNYKITCKPV